MKWFYILGVIFNLLSCSGDAKQTQVVDEDINNVVLENKKTESTNDKFMRGVISLNKGVQTNDREKITNGCILIHSTPYVHVIYGYMSRLCLKYPSVQNFEIAFNEVKFLNPNDEYVVLLAKYYKARSYELGGKKPFKVYFNSEVITENDIKSSQYYWDQLRGATI